MVSNILSSVLPPDTIWDSDCAVAFKLGSISIQWYGVFVFLGFSFAIIASIIKLWKWYKIPLDPFYWFCIIAVPTALFGARFWSCCLGDGQWESFFNFKQGGLAIEGGVILTVIVACIYFPLILKKPKYQIRVEFGEGEPTIKQVSMWNYFDAVVPCILLGHVFGRWGNYFNQELYGAAITNNDGLCNFLRQCLPYMYVDSIGEYCQPLFLYESSANLAMFLIIYFLIELVPFRKCGDLGIIYFLYYGILRMCLEPLRNAQYSFTSTYIMTGLWIAAGVILIILNHTTFPRLRVYRVFYMCYESVRWWILNGSDQRNIKSLTDDIKNAKGNINNLKEQLAYAQKKFDRDKLLHDKNVEKFKRKPNELFYYRGK